MAKPADSKEAFKEIVIYKIVHKEEVEWKSIMISQSIDSDHNVVELLQEIVTPWVTVRGFSITAIAICGWRYIKK